MHHQAQQQQQILCVCVHVSVSIYVYTCLPMYVYVSVRLSVYVCARVHMRTCLQICRIQRLMLAIFLNYSLLYFLKQSFSRNQYHSPRLANQQAPEICPSPLLQHWSYWHRPLHPDFYTCLGPKLKSLCLWH